MDSAFDRVASYFLERASSKDWNRAQSQLDRALRDVVDQLTRGRTSTASSIGLGQSGFLADGFKVRPTNPVGLQVTLQPGLGFIYDAADIPTDIGGALELDDLSPMKPVLISALQTINVPAADPTNARIDIVEVKINRRLEDSILVGILDTGSKTYVNTPKNKTLSWLLNGQVTVNGSPALAINYKTGTPAGSPVAPATSAGYLKIAEVRVGAAAATLDSDVINDLRRARYSSGIIHGSASWLHTAAGPPTTLNVAAPAGVEVAAYWSAIDEGTLFVWGPKIASGTIAMAAGGGAGLVFRVPVYAVPAIAAFNSTQTGQINGASAVRTAKAAVGQVGAAIPFKLFSQAVGLVGAPADQSQMSVTFVLGQD